MKLRILLTGSSGYLGQHVLHSLVKNNFHDYDITASYGSLESFAEDCEKSLGNNNGSKVQLVSGDLLENAEQIWKDYGPFDVIIHMAAMSHLNKCEMDREEATKVNVRLPVKLLQLLQSQPSCSSNMLFVAISTDQVYDGESGGWYTEEDASRPINYYGQTKLDMEHQLLSQATTAAVADNHDVKVVCLRSSNILGGPTPIGMCRKSSFLKWIQSAVTNKGEDVNVFQNEYRNAIYVGDVVQILRSLLSSFKNSSKVPSGVYNMGGNQRVNRYDIAMAVAKHYNITDTSNIHPVDRVFKQDITATARSPLDISMKSSKLETLTGISTSTLDQIVHSSFYYNKNDNNKSS